MKRQQVLALGIGASAMLAAAAPSRVVAHNLPAGKFGSPSYDAALAAKGTKAVFQSANVEASVKQGDTLNHLLLIQAKNWLNGFQFSYQIRPEDLHVVAATYASANLLTYGDPLWKKYKLGEKYNVIDPATGAPATRNVFWASRFGNAAPTDPNDPKGIYQDVGIEALQRRGVVFLT
jgi:hypothetical protein